MEQVAAEPSTLDAFTAILRAQQRERVERPGVAGQIGSIIGWPLVADPRLPRGFVYLRPHPRPAEPAQETTAP
ncbi:hypothetical protein WB403_12500 [Streptomyces brasiliscabiei]|uniref:Uncharacterized protein n=1 Tax=Streptomyces brasiliscabiei TaxID=2736302 RepID=A0ABU8G9V9_9ACTN